MLPASFKVGITKANWPLAGAVFIGDFYPLWRSFLDELHVPGVG